MSNAAVAALAGPWKDLWNGDLGITDQLVAEDFVAHFAPLTGTGGDGFRGREALIGMVRWTARGTYRGGFPGASPEAIGRTITFTGTDTLRIAAGKLAEYWLNADSLLFSQQLGVREVPVQS